MEKSLEEIRKRVEKEKKDRERRMLEMWDKLKPFDSVDDIPSIPIFKDKSLHEKLVVKNLIRCGAIPKDKLEVGATYEGSSRNFHKATWDGKVFWGKRYKWGEWFDDNVNHFEDDNGYDLFVPIRKI